MTHMATDFTTDPTRLRRTVEVMLRERGGILPGKELYQSFGEKAADSIEAVMRALEREGVITINGNIELPLGVFESVYVMTPAHRRHP